MFRSSSTPAAVSGGRRRARLRRPRPDRGIAVPAELSVAGFDDIPAAAHATPALTTVRRPHARKGAEAVRLLLDHDAGPSLLLPTELVIRASTAPAP
jgi:DNA-binding LacI/PurR family transcriptional regulator